MATEPEITNFKIELRLGATFSVNQGDAWIKPEAATSISWSGVPDDEQIKVALAHMAEQILEPTIDDISSAVVERVKKAKGID